MSRARSMQRAAVMLMCSVIAVLQGPGAACADPILIATGNISRTADLRGFVPPQLTNGRFRHDEER